MYKGTLSENVQRWVQRTQNIVCCRVSCSPVIYPPGCPRPCNYHHPIMRMEACTPLLKTFEAENQRKNYISNTLYAWIQWVVSLENIKSSLPLSVSPLCLRALPLSSHLRLKEIDMSEYDAATYERFSTAVRRQVQSLRIILDNLQVSFTPPGSTLSSLFCSLTLYNKRASLFPSWTMESVKPVCDVLNIWQCPHWSNSGC